MILLATKPFTDNCKTIVSFILIKLADKCIAEETPKYTGYIKHPL